MSALAETNGSSSSRFFWYGAGAVLVGVLAERGLRCCTVDNFRAVVYAAAEAKKVLLGRGQTTVEVQEPDDFPMGYQQTGAYVAAREPMLQPPPPAHQGPVPVARPVTAMDVQELNQQSEYHELMQQVAAGSAIDVPWLEQ